MEGGETKLKRRGKREFFGSNLRYKRDPRERARAGGESKKITELESDELS